MPIPGSGDYATAMVVYGAIVTALYRRERTGKGGYVTTSLIAEGTANEILYKTAFTKHPYHWPTIGWMEDIEAFTTLDCEKFYGTYYAPNNAVIVVVGDIEHEATLALIQQHYGALAPSQIPRRARHKPLVLLTLCLGVLVAQVDTSVVNLAMQPIGSAFGASCTRWSSQLRRAMPMPQAESTPASG